jgi:hypothetical protein
MLPYASVASLILTLMFASRSPSPPAAQGAESDKSMSNNITIGIGDQAFPASLSDHATAAAFKKLLPLSITMTELNAPRSSPDCQ